MSTIQHFKLLHQGHPLQLAIKSNLKIHQVSRAAYQKIVEAYDKALPKDGALPNSFELTVTLGNRQKLVVLFVKKEQEVHVEKPESEEEVVFVANGESPQTTALRSYQCSTKVAATIAGLSVLVVAALGLAFYKNANPYISY